MSKSPFAIINKLNEGEFQRVDKTYAVYLTNRFFSYFADTILIANEANQFDNYSVDKQAHFNYYFGSIKKRKRFSKWFKSEITEIEKMVSEYYDCSGIRTKEILSILNDEQKEEIKLWYNEMIGV